MARSMNSTDYICAPGLQWSVESWGILLIIAERNVSRSFKYPEAAVWDLLTRGFDVAHMASMIYYIGGLPDKIAAAEYVSSRLRAWQEEGLLVVNTQGKGHV